MDEPLSCRHRSSYCQSEFDYLSSFHSNVCLPFYLPHCQDLTRPFAWLMVHGVMHYQCASPIPVLRWSHLETAQVRLRGHFILYPVHFWCISCVAGVYDLYRDSYVLSIMARIVHLHIKRSEDSIVLFPSLFLVFLYLRMVLLMGSHCTLLLQQFHLRLV